MEGVRQFLIEPIVYLKKMEREGELLRVLVCEDFEQWVPTLSHTCTFTVVLFLWFYPYS